MKKLFLIASLTSFALSGFCTAAKSTPEAKAMVVGVRQEPPFSLKNADGVWEGISVDLWKEIATDMKLKYEFREMGLEATLEGIQNHSVDVGLGGLAISADRERKVDFTHPYYASGLSIAVPRRSEMYHWMKVMRGLLSPTFLKMIVFMSIVTVLAGLLVWWFERKRNPEHFGGALSQGIGSALWWASVTLCTVGYGDKVPVSFGGRVVGVIWMLVGVVLLAIFTGAMASAVTASHLEASIRGPEELYKSRVASVEGSVSEKYLRHSRIRMMLYPTPQEAIQAVADGRVDAFVYDEPVLKYLANGAALQDKVEVLPYVFQREYYAIALRNESPLREDLNPILLEIIERSSWQETIFRYEGNPAP